MWQERKINEEEKKSTGTYQDSIFDTTGIIRKIPIKRFWLHLQRTKKYHN